MNFYAEKNTTYFTNIRYDLIKLLPNNPNNKVLELGTGGGDTLIEIKRRNLAKEVVGVELMEIPNSNQTNPIIDKFIIADIEKQSLSLPENHFDAILIGDVMEHLADPWKVVDYLSRLLKKGGVFIVSVPNIRFFTAFYKIYLKGDFGYKRDGLFDKTHLRFFCKKNIKELFTTPYLQVQSVTAIEKVRGDADWWKRLLNFISFNGLEEFLALQYIVVAKKI